MTAKERLEMFKRLIATGTEAEMIALIRSIGPTGREAVRWALLDKLPALQEQAERERNPRRETDYTKTAECPRCGAVWLPTMYESETFPGSACDREECFCVACEDDDGPCERHAREGGSRG